MLSRIFILVLGMVSMTSAAFNVSRYVDLLLNDTSAQVTWNGQNRWTVPGRNFIYEWPVNASMDVFRASLTGLETFERAEPCSFRGRPAAIVIECPIVFKSLNLKAFGNAWAEGGRVPSGHIEFSASLRNVFYNLRLKKQNGSVLLSFAPIGGAMIALSYQEDTTFSNWGRAGKNAFEKWINHEYQDLIREEIVWRLNEAFIRIRP